DEGGDGKRRATRLDLPWLRRRIPGVPSPPDQHRLEVALLEGIDPRSIWSLERVHTVNRGQSGVQRLVDRVAAQRVHSPLDLIQERRPVRSRERRNGKCGLPGRQVTERG